MASIDASVARVLDSRRNEADSDDEDALIAALEEDEDQDLVAFREQRLQQLHAEVSRARTMKNQGNGTYTELKDEKSVMDLTTSNKYAIVHFFKPDFGRCGVMDRHLEQLATKHFDTRFIKINVENAPFLVTKLKVQVLPCVICFVDGIGVDRIIGFEGIGFGDDFSTKDLEARLLTSGVLIRAKVQDDDRSRINFTSGKKSKSTEQDDEDDSDWD